MKKDSKITSVFQLISLFLFANLLLSNLGGISTAYAQQVATSTPTPYKTNPPLDGDREASNVELGPQSFDAASNKLDADIQTNSVSIPYLSEYTGAATQNYDCGPATVAMIVMAYGKRPPGLTDRQFIADIRAKMGNTGAVGTTNQQRINALAAYGISSTAITSSPLQTIKNAIAQGRPSIARVWGKTLGRNYDGHVVVVLGFSADFATIFVNDPDNQGNYLNTATPGGANRAWATSTFEAAMLASYDSSNYYGLVINNSLANYSATWVTQSPYPTVAQGQSADLSVTFQNIGTSTWNNSGPYPTRIDTTNPANNAVEFLSPFACPTWLSNSRPGNLSETSVAPGSNGTFNFKICIPSSTAPGTYRISVAPMIEGITYIDPGVIVYWDVTVISKPNYSAAWVSQSPYPTVAQGQSVDLSVTFQNTGIFAWSNSGPNPIHIGTTNPSNGQIDYSYRSPFVCPEWLGPITPTGLVESTVTPGNTGTFQFKICVPSDIAPGTYRISIAPLVEQITWMLQPGVVVYWDITVVPKGTGIDCGHISLDGVILFEHAICNRDRAGRSKVFSSPTDWINLSDFNDITTSIYIQPGWSAKVFQHYKEQENGGSWRCLTGSMWDLKIDHYTNGDTNRIMHDDISSVQVFHSDNCTANSPTRPIFEYPVDGQTLEYERWYLFKVQPVANAEGYLWGFFQNGIMVWENLRDEHTLSSNEYAIGEGSLAHSKFVVGDAQVWVRASVNGQWTDAAIITIHLQSVSETIMLSSVAAQDGWILETAETSNKGGTLNKGAKTLWLGDNAAKKQYRAILSFNTSGIPDNAVITGVTLKVRKQAIVGGGNPVNIFKGFMVDIEKGVFGKSALQTTDFQAKANNAYGPFKPSLTGGWYNLNLTNAKAYINKLATNGGLTQIRLRFKLDDNNDNVANYLSLYSGNAPAAARPQLVIQYYVP